MQPICCRGCLFYRQVRASLASGSSLRVVSVLESSCPFRKVIKMTFRKILLWAGAVGVAMQPTSIGLAAPAAPQHASPTAAPFDLTISNDACFKSEGIRPYIEQAITQRREASTRGDAEELASFYVSVPARSWRGLTVTGVGLNYETTSVYFRESVTRVRRVLRAAGVRVDANGFIPINNDEAVEVQILRKAGGDGRRFGASEVSCGL
jgi:hypothetical protein